MNPLKQLAGQTAVYGLSTILGRLLNFLLVILHTRVFFGEEYGVVTGLYSLIALVNILYTFGMETTFFRFSSRDKSPTVYNTAFTIVTSASILYSLMIYLNASSIEAWTGYPDSSPYIRWIAIILLIDAVLAIPFARLRLENKALKFSIAKVSMILMTIFLNVLFLKWLPDIAEGKYLQSFQDTALSIYHPELGVGYVFLANLLGNMVAVVILAPEIFSVRLSIKKSYAVPMLLYAAPIAIAGFAGMMNENLDKFLFERLLPDNFYPGKTSLQAQGIYGAAFKLSVFMTLGIQAFRYAAEPFFFNQSEQENSRPLFAEVMKYFISAGLIVLVGVSLNVDWIGEIFLKRPEFREALMVVPILLVAKLLFGIYVNLSIWFKITDNTKFGVYFNVLGAAGTVTGNFLLVPVLGYYGAALSAVICYSLMVVSCYLSGQKFYPIPYKFGPSIRDFLIAAALIFTTYLLPVSLNWISGIGLTLLFVIYLYFTQFKKLKVKS